MSKITAIALNTFKEAIRNRILYILLIFALLIMGSSGIISDLSISSKDKIIKDFGVASINFFGLLIAIFVGIGLVYNEIDKKTLYTIVSKPIDRYQFILGKYFGLLFTIYVNLLIMTIFFLGTIYFQYHTSDEQMSKYFFGANYEIKNNPTMFSYIYFLIRSFFLSVYETFGTFFQFYHSDLTANILPVIFLSCVELAIITAFAILFSSFSSPTLSAILTILTFIIGRLNEDILRYAFMIKKNGLTSFGRYFKYYFAQVSVRVTPNLGTFDKRSEMIYSTKVSVEWFPIVYGILYILVVLMIAIFIFRKRNFK